MDYGFHAPTISFPVPGTIMIEPTESEPKDELDRFCDALIAIRGEIQDVDRRSRRRAGQRPEERAAHRRGRVTADEWPHPYTRARAVYPLPFVRARKFWPSVGRIDNAFGDRNLMCACPASRLRRARASAGREVAQGRSGQRVGAVREPLRDGGSKSTRHEIRPTRARSERFHQSLRQFARDTIADLQAVDGDDGDDLPVELVRNASSAPASSSS